MTDDEQILTPEQYEAARLLVARLRCEAAGEWFKFEDIGMAWEETNDPVVVNTDTGHQLRASDLFYAAMVLMWSLIVAKASGDGCDPSEVIADLGLHLAMVEPN